MRIIAGAVSVVALSLGAISPAVAAETQTQNDGQVSIQAKYGNIDHGRQGCSLSDMAKVRGSIRGRAFIDTNGRTKSYGNPNSRWRWEYKFAHERGSCDWTVWATHGEGRVNLTNTRAWCVRYFF